MSSLLSGNRLSLLDQPIGIDASRERQGYARGLANQEQDQRNTSQTIKLAARAYKKALRSGDFRAGAGFLDLLNGAKANGGLGGGIQQAGTLKPAIDNHNRTVQGMVQNQQGNAPIAPQVAPTAQEAPVELFRRNLSNSRLLQSGDAEALSRANAEGLKIGLKPSDIESMMSDAKIPNANSQAPAILAPSNGLPIPTALASSTNTPSTISGRLMSQNGNFYNPDPNGLQIDPKYIEPEKTPSQVGASKFDGISDRYAEAHPEMKMFMEKLKGTSDSDKNEALAKGSALTDIQNEKFGELTGRFADLNGEISSRLSTVRDLRSQVADASYNSGVKSPLEKESLRPTSVVVPQSNSLYEAVTGNPASMIPTPKPQTLSDIVGDLNKGASKNPMPLAPDKAPTNDPSLPVFRDPETGRAISKRKSAAKGTTLFGNIANWAWSGLKDSQKGTMLDRKKSEKDNLSKK